MGVHVTHQPGLAIIFVGCVNCLEFLLSEIQIWPVCRFYCTGELSAYIGIYCR